MIEIVVAEALWALAASQVRPQRLVQIALSASFPLERSRHTVLSTTRIIAITTLTTLPFCAVVKQMRLHVLRVECHCVQACGTVKS